MTKVDIESLPPTIYLMLDVLQARYRMGETHWTFPNRLAKSADRLEGLNLIWVRSGPAQGVFEVRLTDWGKRLLLSKPCTSPVHHPLERVRKLAEAAQAAGTTLLPSQVLAALGEAS